jgi:hypothetical protein
MRYGIAHADELRRRMTPGVTYSGVAASRLATDGRCGSVARGREAGPPTVRTAIVRSPRRLGRRNLWSVRGGAAPAGPPP